MPFTKGFISPSELADHFDDHGGDFNARDEQHYQELADIFLGGPIRTTTLECPSRARDKCLTRYDLVTQEYGVLTPDSYILTYFIPDPARHGHRTNAAYFNADCRRPK